MKKEKRAMQPQLNQGKSGAGSEKARELMKLSMLMKAIEEK